MARIKLTAGRIRDFSCPTGKAQAFLWDTEAPGLALRATPGESRAYIFQSKLNGKALRVTIGDVRAWNLDAARTEARRLQNLLDAGTDPREEKRQRIAEAEAKREEARRIEAPAIEAWNTYIEARRPDWGERHYHNHLALADPGGKPKSRGRRPGEGDTTAPGPLHALLVLPLSELTAEAVESWLRLNASRPTWAAQAYRALRAFIGWCSERPEYRGCVHVDACTQKGVRRAVAPAKSKADDCLQREQLPLWFDHVRRIGNPVQSAYLQALLLTGARREELAGLRWADVDFQWRSMSIRDKVEGERIIPLTPYVASLLAMLPRRNEWVFSSPAAQSGRIQEPRIAHNKALAAAGLPALSLHGLRRSFGTLAEWVECPAGVSAQIMGHKPSALAEKHYRRRPLDLLRKWHTTIEGWILEQAGIEQPHEEQAGQGLRVVG